MVYICLPSSQELSSEIWEEVESFVSQVCLWSDAVGT